MRTKKYFLFDEEKEAEKIINNGFENDIIDYSKMYIIAKYFKKHMKCTKKGLEQELVKFCKKYDKNFNPVLEMEQLKRWVKSAYTYNLRMINEVFISNKDIDFLKSMNTERERKIMFATIVLAKALKIGGTKKKRIITHTSDNYYIRYGNLSDVARLSGISKMRDIDVAKIYHKYKEHFFFYKPEKELIRIDFIDKSPGDKVMISNFDNLAEEYNKFFSDIPDILVCEMCGKSFEKTGRNQRFCKECSENRRRERSRAYKRIERTK